MSGNQTANDLNFRPRSPTHSMNAIVEYMPTPLVLRLQELATDNSSDITELLRKALMVAVKLGLNDFRDWVNSELHGYEALKVPEYRKVRAELKVRNPYHGLVPFLITDQRIVDLVCNVPLQVPVGSIVDLLNNERENGSSLLIPFPNEQKTILMDIQDSNFPLEPVRTIAHNQIAAILDSIRTTILDWALKLESDGIIGDGMAFSEEEKDRAKSSITIENFQGVLGNVSNSSVNQDLDMSIQTNDFDSLRQFLSSNGVEDGDISELQTAIQSDPRPTEANGFGDKVSNWIGNMMTKAASGSWQVGIGAAGGLLSSAISKFYGL